MSLKGVKVQWLGHAAALVTTSQGTSILIDPFFEGNPKFPKQIGEPAHVDMILVTHGHSDHVGDTVRLSKRHKCPTIAMVELAAWLGRQGASDVMGMNLGGAHAFKDVTISMVDAKHSTGMDDKREGRMLYGGVANGFILEIEGGSTLYHAGDTTVFGDMKLIGDLYKPTLGMLPIGDHYTMGPRLAAQAARLLGVEEVLPIHYGTFPVLTGTPEQLRKELKGTAIEVREINPGEILQ